MTVYISGPMTGIRNFNHRAFEKAHEKLEKVFLTYHLQIISPVKIAEIVNMNFGDTNRILCKAKKPRWEDYMKACIKRLPEADFIFLLKGWLNSRGSMLEVHIADELGIPHAESIEELKQKIEEARLWK
jgi:tRNA U54 and U55 pseudouridine synthase Pus10